MARPFPPHVEAGIARGRKLEYWTIAWLATVVPLMALVVGSSQAMKTVWLEDMLGFIPPIVYLISERMERRPPSERFPFGFERVNSLAFLISAVTLTAMGAWLIVEAAMTLLYQEHPTVGTMRLFGHDVWMGWPMIAVLMWSTLPSILLGRLKQPVARTIQDEVLHTDAEMQKADWMTGVAAMVGVIGIGLGYWWADAVAAGLISISILKDGVSQLRSATAELVDGAPRALGSVEVSDEVKALEAVLEARFPGAAIRFRETGRLIHTEIRGATAPFDMDLDALWPGDPDRRWRLAQISFVAAARD